MTLFTQNAQALFPKLPSVISIDGYYIDKRDTDSTWYQQQEPMGEEDEGYELCRGLQHAQGMIEVLRRFADERQPALPKQYIGPGGRLTEEVRGNEALARMFQHRADLCRVLHSEDLLDVATSRELVDIIQSGITDAKDDEYRLLQGVTQRRNEFHWLADFENSVEECTRALFDTYRVARKHFSSISKVRHFVEKMYAMIPPMTRLVVDLMLAEETFETDHANTHICDVKIEKRVKMAVDVPTDAAVMANQRQQVLWHMDILKQYASGYSTRIRNLYAYRYLVEWGHGRPWKQMYLVVDTGKDGIPKDMVDEFLMFTTCTSPLASKMFNVRPMAFSDISNDDICSICQEEYQVNDLVIELRNCRHRMHPECVKGFWDNLHHYDNRCPMCRAENPSIRELFPYFVAEAEDVCYHADTQASGLAVWLDRAVRHRMRRDLPVDRWEVDLQRHYSTREVEAWLADEPFEERLLSEEFFPRRRVEWDESSATTDGESDEEEGDDEDDGEEGDDGDEGVEEEEDDDDGNEGVGENEDEEEDREGNEQGEGNGK